MFKTIRRILDWCDDFRGRLYTGFVFSFFSYWFTAAPVAYAALVLGHILEGQKNGTPIEGIQVWGSFLLILLMIGLRFLFDYMRARFQETISHELIARDRLAIGDALKRVSLGYFQGVSTGRILNSLTTGLTTLENMGIRMLDTFIGGYLSFAVIFLCLLVMRPAIALIALAAAAASFLSLLLISASSRKSAPQEAASSRSLTGAVLEYARGLPVIKSFGTGSAAVSALDEAILESEKAHVRAENGFIPGSCLHLLALRCGTVGMAAAACFAGLHGEIPMHLMLMLLFFSFTIFNALEPVSDTAHVLGVINDAMDQVDLLKIGPFMDEGGEEIPISGHDIELNHVHFGYDSREILKDVSLRIPEKTSTAIVGPSGSGKTTLVNLLARFYDVKSGSISLGGHDVREFTCDSLLSNFSMVFQNVYLFHDTVRSNICFGRPETTEEEMIEAAKKACCHDFIIQLPDGYDTVIGEGGGTLSGGEKQRISIARAILKDAPVIILDEATASIDPENEHLIQKALSELTRGKTVITIAHRLATIEQADQIVVLEDGRIVQKGRHRELIAQDGLYRRFAQARSTAEGWTIQ